MSSNPVHLYDFSEGDAGCEACRSRLRRVEHAGRSGLHIRDLRGYVTLPHHTARERRGTAAMWISFLDELHGRITLPHHRMNNKAPDRYTLLCDRAGMPDPDETNFSLYYSTSPGPQLVAKYHPGFWYDGQVSPEPRAAAWCECWGIERLHWYHVVMTWDHDASAYEIYVDGIHVGTRDHSLPGKRVFWKAGPLLYIGNPAVVYSRVEFYDVPLNQAEVTGLFAAQGGDPDSPVARELRRTWLGEDLQPLDFEPGADWKKSFDSTLQRTGDLCDFLIQGNLGAAEITPEGLEVKTGSWDEFKYGRQNNEVFRQVQFYLWCRKWFEGDLYLRYEFKTLNRQGLSLLMTHAAGIQGEDFLLSHEPRSSGEMLTVIGEDVRNYHWEYYREMYDTRCDRASHYACKQPWLNHTGYQMDTAPWETDRWYRLEYLQRGGHRCGAIDGKRVLDMTDRADTNGGPVFHAGHICIRCMVRSHMLFRNLQVWTRDHFKTTHLSA